MVSNPHETVLLRNIEKTTSENCMLKPQSHTPLFFRLLLIIYNYTILPGRKSWPFMNVSHEQQADIKASVRCSM